MGINFDPSWSDNSSEIYEISSSDILVANIQFPDNALLTGLEIHAKLADTITVNVCKLIRSLPPSQVTLIVYFLVHFFPIMLERDQLWKNLGKQHGNGQRKHNQI